MTIARFANSLSFCLTLALATACANRDICNTVYSQPPGSPPLQVPPIPGIGKNKGTVIIQVGTGHSAPLTDNTKAGQRSGSAATGEQANSSTDHDKNTGPPWYLWLAAAAAGAVAWELLRHKVPARFLALLSRVK